MSNNSLYLHRCKLMGMEWGHLVVELQLVIRTLRLANKLGSRDHLTRDMLVNQAEQIWATYRIRWQPKELTVRVISTTAAMETISSNSSSCRLAWYLARPALCLAISRDLSMSCLYDSLRDHRRRASECPLTHSSNINRCSTTCKGTVNSQVATWASSKCQRGQLIFLTVGKLTWEPSVLSNRLRIRMKFLVSRTSTTTTSTTVIIWFRELMVEQSSRTSSNSKWYSSSRVGRSH